MRVKLLSDWLAVRSIGNDFSGRHAVVDVGADVEDIEAGDTVICAPDCGVPCEAAGGRAKYIRLDDVIGVVLLGRLAEVDA